MRKNKKKPVTSEAWQIKETRNMSDIEHHKKKLSIQFTI